MQCRVNSTGVVEIHIVLYSEPQLRQADIILDFDIFILQSLPEALHLGIIPATSASVHADLDVVFLQFIDKLLAGDGSLNIGKAGFKFLVNILQSKEQIVL